MTIPSAKAALGGGTLLAQGGEDIVDDLTDIVVTYTKGTADSMAADATAATLFWVNPFDFALRVVSAKYVSASAVTGHADNYAVISVRTDDGANSTPAIAASWTTTLAAPGTGTTATDVAEEAVITDANVAIPAGGCLHFGITKEGDGVVVPVSYYTIRLRKVGT